MSRDRQWRAGIGPTFSEGTLHPGADLPEALLQITGNRLPNGVLLGTADDGVIWGRLADGKVVTSAALTIPEPLHRQIGSQVGAKLRRSTLQSLRVFCEARELRVWRTPEGLRAVWVEESAEDEGPKVACLDDEHPLLGSEGNPGRPPQLQLDGTVFSILRGRAGEVHAPPIPYPPTGTLVLRVRNYYHLHDPLFPQIPEHKTPTWQLRDTRWLSLDVSN